MAGMEARLNTRQKSFMHVPDVGDVKKKREEHEEELRKSKRYELASKRRNLSSLSTPTELDLGSIIRLAAEGTDPLQAASGLRRLLTVKSDPPSQQIIDAGLLPQLLAWLERDDIPALQYESCWALTNIASGSHEHAEALVLRGIVPHIYRLLESPDDTVKEQAAWLAANITGDSAALRDTVLQTAGLERLLKVMGNNPPQSVAKVTIWAVSNLCRGKPAPKYERVRPALPFLAAMILGLEDTNTLKECLWAVSCMCHGESTRIQDLIDSGIVPRLISIAQSPLTKIQLPALRCIGNVAAGTAEQTELVVNPTVFEILVNALKSPKGKIRKEAAWISSNLSAGPSSHLQSLLTSHLFPMLLSILPTDLSEIQHEILYALINSSLSELKEVPLALIQLGIFPALHQVLDSTKSAKVMQETLELIRALLEAGKKHFTTDMEGNWVCQEVEKSGCLAKIEDLQRYPNDLIYKKAVRIIDDYFEVEEQPDLLTSSILAVPLQFEM